MPTTLRLISFLTLALLLPTGAFAQTEASAESAAADASLPHDSHAGMTVSAAPLTDPSETKHTFGKADPLRAGILPVEVFLRNHTSEPIQIDIATIQLDVHYQDGRIDGIDSLTPSQVANAIAHPNGVPSPRARRFPIGAAPMADKKTDKLADILRPLSLDSDIVPPMGTIHGFVFFDLRHDLSLVNRSSLYLPSAVVIPSKKPLIFFEVSFAKSSEPGGRTTP